MFVAKWVGLLSILLAGSTVLAGCLAVTQENTLAEDFAVVETEVAPEVTTVVVEAAPAGEARTEKITAEFNLGTEPPTIDPSTAFDTIAIGLDENLFLGLTGFDEQGNVTEELATAWTVSDDGLVYTFTMRGDATWVNYRPSTGVVEIAPVTAHDIVYAVRRTCDPRTGSGYAYVDYIIAGCRNLNTANPATLSEDELQSLLEAVGVRALNDTTVEFTIDTPAPYFPAIAGMWVNRPEPQAAIEEFGERWTEAGNIVTNGPYVLTAWYHGDNMTLEKNPYWYGWSEGASGNIDRVKFVMIQEASTEFAMYEAGELDSAGVPFPDTDRVEADPVLSQELVRSPVPCTYYYGFVTTKAPMDNVLVRRALSAAIDRESLVENVLKGGQIPANTFAPSMIFGNAAGDPEIAPWALSEEQGGTGYEKAVEQAKAWLAEAGYPDGKGFPAITLMFNTSEAHAQIAQAIQSMWQESLNITVNLENQEWAVYTTTIGHETPIEEVPHVFRLGWCADYPDENNWVHESFNSNASANALRWEATANAPLGPEGQSFNQLTEAAQRSQDPEERQKLYKEAEKILNDTGAGIAPIYYYSRVVVTKPYLHRTYYNLGGDHLETWVLDWQAKKKATGD